MLTACLSLVRPAGMSPNDADTWLMVAAEELRDIPEDLLADGCKHARRTATHHREIVALVIGHTKDALATRKRLRRHALDARNALPAPGRHRLTQDEVDEIVQERGRRMSVYRDNGMIVERGGCFYPGGRT